MDVRSRTDLIAGLTGASGANGTDPFAETEKPALLAAIVESSDDAIIGCDLEGIIRTWTKGAERIFGYQAHEVIGRPASILAPAERPNEVSYILARIRRGEHIDPYEAVRCRKDGQRIVVSLTVSPILNRSGEIIGSSKIARRISQTQKLEETLRTFDTQLMLLAEASSAVLASPHTADVLRTIIELAQRLGSADGNAVWRRRDTDGVWMLVSSAGLSREYVETRVTEPSGSQLLPRGPLSIRGRN